MLARFGRWFSSSGGVWQTTVIVLLWWLAEFGGLIHDPQHIQLCVWLTIYSAVTQPVLAWVNKQDSGKSDATLARLEAKEDDELEILKGTERE